MKFINFVFHLLCECFNIYTKEVNIGLSPAISTNLRHGVIHAQSASGDVIRLPYIVDHPDKLNNPSMYAIKSMFYQIRRLGYLPRHLEVMVGDTIKVYELGKMNPIFVQKKH